MKEINLFDVVFLKENLSGINLPSGTVGTVIYVYKPKKVFEVDFINKEGFSIASVTVERSQIDLIEEYQRLIEFTIFKIEI